MSAQARARREQVRFAAGEMFAVGASDRQVAEQFRVSRMSANRCHRAFDESGTDALASKGPGGRGTS
ncbi:hypothetical protein Aple_084110 [Acrocarpospora pleiomorpha]|uniref:Uncharacterized protein n=1 Tax=Acrocarpospora pleiomorpha TaxID=90975 RepID=A0A5M3XX03_9ACTN|nr:helix-turn-helix domain-containing protein [Acrocarpospora pleiomorpha]GES25512.1 hypothetical protein Aple_084110 [Acrocarpospora pleiomorpha]